MQNFEKVINSLRASKKVSIFITGSNSRLLSEELSTVLSGRYVSFKINPLSYKEILELLGKEKSTDEIFENYMKQGSLPNRFEFKKEEAIKNNKTEMDKSYAIENIVYNELLIKGYDVYTGKIKNSEFEAFNVINDNYLKYVITLDKLTYEFNGIKHVNLIDFLLDDNF